MLGDVKIMQHLFLSHHSDRFHRAGFGTAGAAGTAIVFIQHGVGFLVAVDIGFTQGDAAQWTIARADTASHAELIIDDGFFLISHGLRPPFPDRRSPGPQGRFWWGFRFFYPSP